MSALLGAVNLFGFMVLFTSIGGDAIGLGVAAVLILVGSAGKAVIDNRNQRANQVTNQKLMQAIEGQHEETSERLEVLSRDVVKLGVRITDLEQALTTPDRP